MRRYVALLPLLLLSACKPAEQGHLKAIIGAVLIDGRGGPPLSNSVVVIEGNTIRDAGSESAVPIPDDADKINGAGKFLVPELVDAWPQSMTGAVTEKANVLYLDGASQEAAQAALESARERHAAAIARIRTQAEAQFMIDKGATALLGMIGDTEALDAGLLRRLRDLQIVVAPALASMSPGPEADIARRNTKRLFDSGVLVATASAGGNLQNEAEALVEAGIPPLDVIVAATSNAARALGQQSRSGTIQPGHAAGMLLLSGNPGEDIRNLRRIAGRIRDGNWTEK